MRGGREIFAVAIDNPQTLGARFGPALPAGGTIFEYRYEIFPPDQAPRPVPAPPPAGR